MKDELTIKFIEIYRLNMSFENNPLASDLPFSLNFRGKLLSLDRPRIMGILNLTPDSFSDGGHYNTRQAAVDHVGHMLEEGADMIDIGGYSSRPGAPDISPEEELSRVYEITETLIRYFPDTIFSIDTFRATVARAMLELGVHMVNDIYAGRRDPEMMDTVRSFHVPYVMMHMQGTPETMQDNPSYQNIVQEVWHFFVDRISEAHNLGIKDLIIDPGFGFGKSLTHNYQLLEAFDFFRELRIPLLAGISRKSMIYKLLNTPPDNVLEVATALHLRLLEKGALILRVHDVQAAYRIVAVYQYIKEYGVV